MYCQHKPDVNDDSTESFSVAIFIALFILCELVTFFQNISQVDYS